MSTYLVAYVIGEYDYIETSDVNGTLIRVYTPIGKYEMGRFSLDVNNLLVKSFKFYSNCF
jgi:puromycin-sensitive aminopeptidase